MKKHPVLKRCVDYLVYLVIRLVICLVQSLSLEMCRSIADGLAVLFADVIRVRRRLLIDNLTHAFPEMKSAEIEQLIRGIWRHLFLLVAEVALAPRRLCETNWWHHVRMVYSQEMLPLIHQDRALIMVTGHLGNFEIGGYTLGLLGYPTFSVARTLDNPYLNRFIAEFRESTGQFLISKNEGYDEILDVLRNRGTVAFLADQSAGPKGCWVRFFDRPASAYKAMALLSIEYDAPIMVCAALRRDGLPLQFNMTGIAFLDPRNRPDNLTSIKQITQWFTTELEKTIRTVPDQYWWIHNRWKTYGRNISL